MLLRITTRIAHCKSVVELGEREEHAVTGFVREPAKSVMVPAHARRRHVVVEKRMADLAKWAETCGLNRIEMGDSSDVADRVRGAGTPRAANTVLIGALSRQLALPEEVWRRALEICLRPDLLGVDLKALDLGRSAG